VSAPLTTEQIAAMRPAELGFALLLRALIIAGSSDPAVRAWAKAEGRQIADYVKAHDLMDAILAAGPPGA
jgi:hypothetical protein